MHVEEKQPGNKGEYTQECTGSDSPLPGRRHAGFPARQSEDRAPQGEVIPFQGCRAVDHGVRPMCLVAEDEPKADGMERLAGQAAQLTDERGAPQKNPP